MQRIYRGALSRDAKESEVDELKELYVKIEAAGTSDAPAQDWATLSCFSVYTTLEALFY